MRRERYEDQKPHSDQDIGRAVVRLAQPLVARRPHPPAELSSYGTRAVILVPRNPALKERTGVELVPLADGRALISFDDAGDPEGRTSI